ncbi:MAG: Spy/CpxP family protein refolding chaperone [bacterium]
MKHKSFFTIALVITFLLATVISAQARMFGDGRCNKSNRGMRKGHRQCGIDMCLSDLDLSSEQITQLRQIREEHRKNMESIRTDQRQYRKDMRELMQKGTDADQISLEKMLNQGAESWKKREKEKLVYRQKLFGLLTQEQKNKVYMCENFKLRPRGQDQKGPSFFPEKEE